MSTLKNTFVLGGVKSGKSHYAESLVESHGRGLYLATAKKELEDLDMLNRIRVHEARRGKAWQTIEEPIQIARVISEKACLERTILVDCLTLWVTNLMLAEKNIENEFRDLTEALKGAAGPVVVVSNEVGLGGISGNELAREFADHIGYLNQLMAKTCKCVVMVLAGLNITVKDE